MRRSFVDTVRDLRAGIVLEQLDEGLQTLVQQVQRTNKVLEAAFRATWARIEQETATRILLGSPE